MIRVDQAFKSFGRTRAVAGVSFALQPGCITGLLGPNGAGKTTTIRLIAGYLRPDRGSIHVGGIDVVADPIGARRRLGYLPESAPLYPELRPGEYLDYRARLFGLGRTDRRRAVAAAMERCRLNEMAGTRIRVLSKGYRQRVGLASALLHDPPVLILDEPTNGLDPSQMRSTRELIADLAAERTVLLCTHVIPEVERTCARVVVIAGGRVVADDTPAGLLQGAAGVEMECRGPDDEGLRRAVSAAVGSGVVMADLGGGWLRLTAEAGGPETAERLAGAAALAGRAVRRLGPRAARLEDRVVDLIESAG